MIRHRRLRPALAVFPLAVAMIEPGFPTLLVAAIGTSVLTEPCLAATCQAAIALPAITARTEKERRAATRRSSPTLSVEPSPPNTNCISWRKPMPPPPTRRHWSFATP